MRSTALASSTPEPTACRVALGCMRVRVWIQGADGPSRDFELVEAPRVGERISITHGSHSEDGVVETVTWNLQAIEAASGLSLEADPVGTVSIVHVICRPIAEVIRGTFSTVEVNQASGETAVN